MEDYQRVIERFCDDIKVTKKAATGGPSLNPALSIAPDTPQPRNVRQKPNQEISDRNQGRPQQQQPGRVSFQGNQPQGRHGGGGGGGGGRGGAWAPNAWGNPWGAPAPRVPRLSMDDRKKKGSLVLRPGSSLRDYLAPSCTKYCAPFQILGKSCEPNNNCTCRHLVFGRWSDEEKGDQIAYVERNKAQLMFAPGTRLPDNQQHLIQNGERK